MLAASSKSRLGRLYERSNATGAAISKNYIVSSAVCAGLRQRFHGLPGVFRGPKKVAGKVLADGKLNANWRSKSS